MADVARVRLRNKSTGEYLTPATMDATTMGDLSAAGSFGGLPPGTSPGSYDIAGGAGRRSRSWRPGYYGPNFSLVYALNELRDKSRDQSRKNPYAGAVVDKIVTNTIGTGIKPQSTAPDAGFRRAADQLWWDWCDEADASGAHDFYGLQAIACRSLVEGGESMIRMRARRMTDMDTVPMQLQLMEGDQCDHLFNDSGRQIRAGIQYDLIGARTGFWLWNEHPGDSFFTGAGLERRLVPAADVCHIYRAMRPGQDRGEPWMARALRALHDLDSYLDAELLRKKMAAMFVGFISKESDGTNPIGSDDPSADGSASLQFEPGTLQILDDDESVTFSQPTDVGANFETFVRQNLRSIAVGAGVLYEELTGDYGQLNDRTMRAAFNAFRRSVEMWQHHLFVHQACRPIYRRWIDLALMSGRLTLPAGMAVTDAYRAKWLPQMWPYIHPVQDVEGKSLEISSGLSSRSIKVSETGYNSADIDNENAEDNKRADSLGLVYTSDARTGVLTTAPQISGAKSDG